jgi:hypothetical protein
VSSPLSSFPSHHRLDSACSWPLDEEGEERVL